VTGIDPAAQSAYWDDVDNAFAAAGLRPNGAWDQSPETHSLYVAWVFFAGHPAFAAWGPGVEMNLLWDENGWHWTDTFGHWRPLIAGHLQPAAEDVAAAVALLAARHLDRIPVTAASAPAPV